MTSYLSSMHSEPIELTPFSPEKKRKILVEDNLMKIGLELWLLEEVQEFIFQFPGIARKSKWSIR